MRHEFEGQISYRKHFNSVFYIDFCQICALVVQKFQNILYWKNQVGIPVNDYVVRWLHIAAIGFKYSERRFKFACNKFQLTWIHFSCEAEHWPQKVVGLDVTVSLSNSLDCKINLILLSRGTVVSEKTCIEQYKTRSVATNSREMILSVYSYKMDHLYCIAMNSKNFKRNIEFNFLPACICWTERALLVKTDDLSSRRPVCTMSKRGEAVCNIVQKR